MDNYSLYLDHQVIAPLVRTLEEIVEATQKEQQYQYETYEIRKPIYEEFIRILHQAYQENHSEVKEAEERVGTRHPKEDLAAFMQAIGHSHALPKKNKATQPPEKLGMELKLVDWIIGEDKCLFSKREIDDKVREFGGSKRPAPMKKVIEMLKKYKLNHLIVVARNGDKHYVVHEESKEASEDEVKVEYDSREIEPEVKEERRNKEQASWEEIVLQPIKAGTSEDRQNSQVFKQEDTIPEYVMEEAGLQSELRGEIYDSEEESPELELNRHQ